jgi:hypothetical protein
MMGSGVTLEKISIRFSVVPSKAWSRSAPIWSANEDNMPISFLCNSFSSDACGAINEVESLIWDTLVKRSCFNKRKKKELDRIKLI